MDFGALSHHLAQVARPVALRFTRRSPKSKPIAAGPPSVAVSRQVDWISGGREILCRCCGGHLGHVFMDGQSLGAKAAERHCVNSLAIDYAAGTAGGQLENPKVEDDLEREDMPCDMSTFHRQLLEHCHQPKGHTVSLALGCSSCGVTSSIPCRKRPGEDGSYSGVMTSLG